MKYNFRKKPILLSAIILLLSFIVIFFIVIYIGSFYYEIEEIVKVFDLYFLYSEENSQYFLRNCGLIIMISVIIGLIVYWIGYRRYIIERQR